jgi:hypothetical protein
LTDPSCQEPRQEDGGLVPWVAPLGVGKRSQPLSGVFVDRNREPAHHRLSMARSGRA